VQIFLNMIQRLLFFALCCAFSHSLLGQTAKDFTVPLKAEVTLNPAKVVLSWPNPGNANLVVLRRTKGQTGTQWTGVLNAMTSNLTSLTDNNVTTGQTYEYVIQRDLGGLFAFGYAHAAIGVPQLDNRGTVLLFVDSTLYAPLSVEIDRLRSDLIGDGWRIQEFGTGASATVASVKSQIVSAYNAAPNGTVRSVYLLGAIPVPYSGNTNWDGHAEHAGAWPADSYYGDLNGNWTDVSVNNVTPARSANVNIPGDGKFDQSIIPSSIELEVGRVDFRRLNPATFGVPTIELYRRYLNKNHAWRQKQYVAQNKALVDDNFGYFGGEAFAANGWRNAYPLVGDSNVVAADFFNDTDGDPYLMAYGCGGGTYNSAGGVGSSDNLATDSINAVFSMLFGSYHGDWDFETNPFMPAALASKGGILTCTWAGRPHWFMQALASGETIGYCTKETQNAGTNNGFYNSTGRGGPHTTLLGDPTLRAHVVAPPENLAATTVCTDVSLQWQPANQSGIIGYHVYRATDRNGPYTRLTTQPVADNVYTDAAPNKQVYWYQVRSLRQETSYAGGKYTNSSTGALLKVDLTGALPPDISIAPPATLTCKDTTVILQGSSQTAGATFAWLGLNNFFSTEQNPAVNEAGDYLLVVTGPNGCTNSAETTVLEDVAAPVFDINIPNTITCSNPAINCNWVVPNTPGISWTVDGTPVSVGQTVSLCPVPGVPGTQSTVTATSTSTGCSSADEFVVETDVSAPTVEIIRGDSLVCPNWLPTLTAAVGPTNAAFVWTGPGGGMSTQKTILILPTMAGMYTLTATNPNGCTSTAVEQITSIPQVPPVLINPVITPESGAGASNGAIEINVVGGTPPTTYLWSDGSTTEDRFNIPSGTYILTVTDGNGCTSIFVVQVPLISSSPALPELFTAFTLQPNPSNGPITVEIQLKTALGMQMEIWSTDGRLLQNRPLAAALYMREVLNNGTLSTGVYILKIILEDGTIATKSFIIQ
jgi:hypothetical protein